MPKKKKKSYLYILQQYPEKKKTHNYLSLASQMEQVIEHVLKNTLLEHHPFSKINFRQPDSLAICFQPYPVQAVPYTLRTFHISLPSHVLFLCSACSSSLVCLEKSYDSFKILLAKYFCKYSSYV